LIVFMQLKDRPPSTTPFEWMGGEERVKALVERFYDLMDLEPEFARLRQVHGSSLEQARQRTFWFLCGWLGGPQYYTEQFGHPRLRARHMHVAIGIQERDEWLACMARALAQTGVPEDLSARLQESFFQTADWMRNQGVPQ
jgi:hemoglobin